MTQKLQINNCIYDVYFVEQNHVGLQHGKALGHVHLLTKKYLSIKI